MKTTLMCEDDQASLIRNTNGEILMWIGTATDIHDQKMIDEKKDEFIGIASHELKTPLTSLKAYTQLLERSLLDINEEAPKVYLAKTNEYIGRLHNLISDLLDVSKIQAGKLTLNISDFNFHAFTEDIIECFKQTHPSHKLILKGEAKINVRGDKYRLEQVFTNYILNAAKYSPKVIRSSLRFLSILKAFRFLSPILV